ncbi:Rv3654c family TadE-like protein [Rudaeicoccus suwonensis]|uniref:Secretion/DNA translocation related TadE-like protein n=1 Tax=Rudaeicoccus suwonensis TaxID=657409 RepID=A0A561E305_9MICO|nr:Rv3654c family TadE-like protein [Rudaeicoccus suwonensis]TWE09998.1 secretion/DNA translocation related TadE-like protein [Rudaeicoccus suwonensis]
MRRQQGSATVLVVGIVGVLVSLLFGAMALVSAVQASHQARAAADMAALAAAGVMVDPGAASTSGACAAAGTVAHRNHARMAGCEVTGQEVIVVAAVRAGWRGLPEATARARAGPG